MHSVRILPLLKSFLALVSLLLVSSSAPLIPQLYLVNFELSATRSFRPVHTRGGIGIWGACLHPSNQSSLSCAFSSPLSSATRPLTSLPTLPSLLPVYFPLLLSFLLTLSLACALLHHVLCSLILWGDLTEFGRTSSSGKKESSLDSAHTEGGVRFGGTRWRTRWISVSRELGVIGAGGCIGVISIILFPLLPTFYIMANAIPFESSTPTDQNVTSIFFIPGWGTLLLLLSTVLLLTAHPVPRQASSRPYPSSRSTRTSSLSALNSKKTRRQGQENKRTGSLGSWEDAQRGTHPSDLTSPGEPTASAGPPAYDSDSSKGLEHPVSKLAGDSMTAEPVWIPLLTFEGLGEGEGEAELVGVEVWTY